MPIICTCGSNTRLKFQIETRKIERGIAVIPHVLITTCLMYIRCTRIVFWLYLLMGDELGSATDDIDRLLVSS